MTPIKLTNFAYDEGQTGFANGCAFDQNPYDDGKSYNATHALAWAKGWYAASKEATNA